MSDVGNGKASLYKKMVAVMDEMSRIPKRGRNEHFGYDYVRSEDVADAVRQAMVKAGLAFSIALIQDERLVVGTDRRGNERVMTRALFDMTLADTDTGEALTIPWRGEGIDGEDKGFSKAATAAMKYFLLKTFVVSTGDEPDSDADPGDGENGNSPRQQPQQRRRPQPRQRKKVPNRPYTPETLCIGLRKKAVGSTKPATKKQIQFAASAVKKVIPDDDDAHLLLAYFFDGVSSFSDLTAGQASALIEWVGATKENEYTPPAYSVQEAGAAVLAAKIAAGQELLPLDDEDAEVPWDEEVAYEDMNASDPERADPRIPVGLDELSIGDFYKAVGEMDVEGECPYEDMKVAPLAKLIQSVTGSREPFGELTNGAIWAMLYDHALAPEEIA